MLCFFDLCGWSPEILWNRKTLCMFTNRLQYRLVVNVVHFVSRKIEPGSAVGVDTIVFSALLQPAATTISSDIYTIVLSPQLPWLLQKKKQGAIDASFLARSLKTVPSHQQS